MEIMYQSQTESQTNLLQAARNSLTFDEKSNFKYKIFVIFSILYITVNKKVTFFYRMCKYLREVCFKC